MPDDLPWIDRDVDPEPRSSRRRLQQDIRTDKGDTFTVKGMEVKVKEVPESPSAG